MLVLRQCLPLLGWACLQAVLGTHHHFLIDALVAVPRTRLSL